MKAYWAIDLVEIMNSGQLIAFKEPCFSTNTMKTNDLLFRVYFTRPPIPKFSLLTPPFVLTADLSQDNDYLRMDDICPSQADMFHEIEPDLVIENQRVYS